MKFYFGSRVQHQASLSEEEMVLDELSENYIVAFTLENGVFVIRERCDNHFAVEMSVQEFDKLLGELHDLRNLYQ